MNQKNEFMVQDESKYIEYKESKTNLSKSLFESYSAFANTSGGIIYLGVTEELDHKGNRSYPIIGIDNPQIQEEQLTAKFNDPNVVTYNSVEEISIKTTNHGKKFIEIIVNEAPRDKKPVEVVDNKSKTMRAFIREGSRDKLARGEIYQALIRDKSDNLDRDVLRNCTIDDLDMQSINEYRLRVQSRPKFASYQEYSIEEFLERIGVIAKAYNCDGEKGITAGGLLFFGKTTAIIQNFPNFQLDLFDRRSDKRWRNRISTVSDDLNLYYFFIKSMDYLQNLPEDQFELGKDQSRLEIGESMRVALREALINLIMHADYYSEEHSIVNVYWDYYDFINGGSMKIPKEDFFTTNESKTRNPIISKLLVFMGYGERGGTGGEQIFAAARYGKFRFPEIDTDIEKTHLRIWSVDFADSIEEIDDHEKMILKLLTKEGEELSKKEIQRITNLSRYYVTKALDTLIKKGYVLETGAGRSTKHIVNRTLEQQVATIKQQAADLRITEKMRV
ncbi:RNA-binding domain-containing protein [Vagococcus xieshaowenii]|uniref:Winged helix-turn-helix transcriptional regulator n=1 Tax=Vagococcus xieshaowenii TaxID=2562451 RepID=A0AAJ5JKR1_9ENTE|nr:RNA-binding domain-containing protein [Vagococcus xieshaowenii]QCA29447.1 winged helix-turn-helix transcriptional regulator [Vagococcus xieshaowenii]TFZ39625.1 winged helix-turn-helix transcriptional regulator [Vagococcus xieshaowenii]